MLDNKIFVTGKAGSGKNYVINIIREIEPRFKIVKIAEPLYHLIALVKRDCLNDAVEMLKRIGFKEYTARNIVIDVIENIDYNSLYLEKPRQPLQVAGDVIRKYDKNILIQYAYLQAICIDKVIIEDVRLVKEADYFISKGFEGIKVCANDDTRLKRLKARDGSYNKKDLLHNTELEIDLIDDLIIVENNGSTTKEEIMNQLSKKNIHVDRGLTWML